MRFPSIASPAVAVTLSLAIAVTSGCFVLERDYPDRRSHLVEFVDVVDFEQSSDPVEVAIGIEVFRVSEGFDGLELVIRESKTEYSTDYYNEHFVPPSDALTEVARRAFQASGLFERVASQGRGTTDYTVVGTVQKLCGDVRDDPRAVIEAQLGVLARDEAGVQRVVYESDVTEFEPLGDDSSAEIFEGLSRVCSRALSNFVKDAAAAIAEDLAKRSP